MKRKGMLLANVDTSSLTWRHILTGAKCILLRLVKTLLHVRDLARKEKQIKWKKEIFAFPWLDLDGLGFSFLTEEKIRHLPVSRWPIHPEEIATDALFLPQGQVFYRLNVWWKHLSLAHSWLQHSCAKKCCQLWGGRTPYLSLASVLPRGNRS